MMRQENFAILQGLVCVAWADGHFAEQEREMLESLIVAFEADEAQTAEIRAFAAEKKTLEDVPVFDLSDDDARVLLQHATLLTWVDGEQHDDEVAFLHQLSRHIGIPDEEASALIGIANKRAQQFLKLL